MQKKPHYIKIFYEGMDWYIPAYRTLEDCFKMGSLIEVISDVAFLDPKTTVKVELKPWNPEENQLGQEPCGHSVDQFKVCGHSIEKNIQAKQGGAGEEKNKQNGISNEIIANIEDLCMSLQVPYRKLSREQILKNLTEHFCFKKISFLRRDFCWTGFSLKSQNFVRQEFKFPFPKAELDNFLVFAERINAPKFLTDKEIKDMPLVEDLLQEIREHLTPKVPGSDTENYIQKIEEAIIAVVVDLEKKLDKFNDGNLESEKSKAFEEQLRIASSAKLIEGLLGAKAQMNAQIAKEILARLAWAEQYKTELAATQNMCAELGTKLAVCENANKVLEQDRQEKDKIIIDLKTKLKCSILENTWPCTWWKRDV